MEALYGSASPMWTTIPSAAFAFQTPVGIGNGPIGSPLFGSSLLPGVTGGIPNGSPALATPAPASTYGYGAGLVTIAPQGVSGLTAASLLAAVAMRRGQPHGPTSDQEVEDLIYDALELLTGATDVEIRCEGGRATLTGTVPHKRVKHDVGEIVWAIPALHDVQNNGTIASRRRTRASTRETEASPSGAARKQS
jgi:hypothetical protein